MTYGTGAGRVSPGDEAPPGRATPPPLEPEKWEALVGELTECGHRTVDRVSDRFRENVKKARAGRYNLGAYLDDVKWFWDELAKETSDVVTGLKRRDPT